MDKLHAAGGEARAAGAARRGIDGCDKNCTAGGADLRQVKHHPSRSNLLGSRSQSGPDRRGNRQSRPSMYSNGGADDG